MDVVVRDGRIVGVRGRAGDRVNRGRLEPKDLYAWQANASADRLPRPLVREGGRLVASDWPTTMGRIVARSRELIASRRPEAVASYTSGQLFLEEYYTLARAGIGTPHLDGNTRLCTATAAEALKESFGSDGQPGSYEDIDHANAIALFGHNIAETQVVQWMRILDRLDGDEPPRLLCVDPRLTPVARRATVHLAPRLGTNVALLNALLHEVIRRGWTHPGFIARHTVGFKTLRRQVEPCTARWASGICGVPAATWGEKTDTFTNADRTVHLSEKDVDPPGDARPDLDIFLEYAARMGFEDKDGGRLVHWSGPEEAFEAWKRCSAGRPCDYTGLNYEKLRGPSGIQWPCTEHAPDGTDRLSADGVEWARPDQCETYGKDLVTGEPLGEEAYRSMNPDGKALIRPSPYVPPQEWPDEDHPFQLTTGRTRYHFHTRTKAGRVPQLVDAAPDVWVEIADADAARLGLAEGDLVEVTTRCGALRGRLRVGSVRPGVLFVPFHYGYWDTPGGKPGTPGRAANEVIATHWDPASKQQQFKTLRLLPEPDVQTPQGGDLVLCQGLGSVRRCRPPLDADRRIAFDPALALPPADRLARDGQLPVDGVGAHLVRPRSRQFGQYLRQRRVVDRGDGETGWLRAPGGRARSALARP
ncbi:molybdopterin oxidoreductase family protein [Streptomyces sp. E-08]|uniref:molybdopterin oxidoreductase family protein n=1 Tax=Streptomyces sp. E-08 TaxID=3404047 RepID=UPI003CF80973